MHNPSVYLIKKSSIYISFLTAILCLYGCPYSSVYRIDQEPEVHVEDMYIGKWATMATVPNGKKYPVKMIFDKYSEFEYNIFFTGYMKDLDPFRLSVNDTIRGTAFMSIVSDRKILNINIRGEYYLAECKYQNGKLSVFPLCDHFTNKIIKRSSELRLALEWHFKSRVFPLYDETYSLKDMVRVE